MISLAVSLLAGAVLAFAASAKHESRDPDYADGLSVAGVLLITAAAAVVLWS